MEININTEITQNELKEIKKIEQRQFLKRIILSLILIFIVGLFLTLMGSLGEYDLIEETKTYNKETKEHLITQSFYVNRISLGLGLGIVFACLFIIYSNYRFINKKISELFYFEKHSLKISSKINDDGILFEGFQSKISFSWSVFERYFISNDYLFLYKHTEFMSSIIIPIIGLTKDEKNLVENILNTKISKFKKVNQPPHQNKF
jgi:hypothetical protein